MARLQLSRPTSRHDPATRQPTSPTVRSPLRLLRSQRPDHPAPACARSDDDGNRNSVRPLDSVERAHKKSDFRRPRVGHGLGLGGGARPIGAGWGVHGGLGTPAGVWEGGAAVPGGGQEGARGGRAGCERERGRGEGEREGGETRTARACTLWRGEERGGVVHRTASIFYRALQRISGWEGLLTGFRCVPEPALSRKAVRGGERGPWGRGVNKALNCV